MCEPHVLVPTDYFRTKTVQSFIEWFEKNCMQVNLTKTWELLLRGKTTRTPPEPLEIIGRKEKLKLLGVTFEQVPVNWDTHIDY